LKDRSETNRPIALVTGANRGIGLELVRQLAGRGFRAILGSRDEGRGEEAAEGLRREGLEVEVARLDVADPAGVAALGARLADQHGRLDVLVNNAAIHYLAFLFGYALTSLPLLRAGFAIAAVVPIALASDTLSIAVMEIVDNGILLIIPGAMDAGLGDVLFWGSLSVALVIAGAFALPVNRWLIARGKGHAVVHETGIHGGPSPSLIGAIAAVAGVFGTVVLVAEAISG
jgi:NAD(P)-dependent dehydrogenase (short-subunit alcohol dehydrogenase family)